MKKEISGEEKFVLRPYSLKELSDLYGVCTKTFNKWIEPFKASVGEKRGRFYTVNQVKTIIEKIGLPDIIDTE